MISCRNALRFILICTVLLALGGCYPGTATDAPGAGAQPSGMPVTDPRTPSSLEAMQRGVTSVTPPASPLRDIHFDFDRDELRGDAREILRANAEWLKANPSTIVEIEGHCDDLGTNEYNLALGMHRALRAKDYLVSLGIAPDRLPVASYGEEAPACLEPTEECRRTNRRARFVIVIYLPAS